MKKILLLHGWNYRNYTKMTDATDAWHNRENFVKNLEKKYSVYKLNFPGFCGAKEPLKAWNLDDFANYVHEYLEKNNLQVDFILGYSFGGAVAIKYQRLFDSTQRIILISPAITRNRDKSKKYMKTPKILEPVRNILRNFYIIHIIKTNEMVHGTKFLRETYQNIVRVELLEELEKIEPKYVNIIYGRKDKMVNPEFIYSNIKKEYQKHIYFIDDGGHDIANTFTTEVLKIIDNIDK